MATGTETTIGIDGKELRLSNLDKVLYPETGFTKSAVIDYYLRVADVLLPHLEGRPITLKRYPDGLDGKSFYEKQCPSHRPDWIETVEVPKRAGGVTDYCLVDDRADLAWLANLAALELHPLIGRAPRLDCATGIVFDLDPGAPAGLLDAASVACTVRERLDDAGMPTRVKVSGGTGVHVWVPLDAPRSFDDTKPFAQRIARELASDEPERVVAKMAKAERSGRVFIDWSQNDEHKTTVAPYSLRGQGAPWVSAPVTWEELEAAVDADDEDALRFTPDDVLARVEADGDLFA